MSDKRTRITFRFVRPIAINLPSFPEAGLTLGNYYPHYEKYDKKIGDMEIPVGVYDLSVATEITLLNELPEELPPYLAQQADEDIKTAYKIDQVKTATRNNAICEEVRRYLDHYERAGNIQVLHDSFKSDGGSPVPVKPTRKRTTRKKATK